jgi:hypothetical protein
VLVLLAGCATLPPPAPPAAHASPPAATQPPPAQAAPSATPPVAPGTQVGTTASGGTIRVNETIRDTLAAAAAPDTTPSRDAVAVLQTIPEPLGRPSDRVPAREPRPSVAPAHLAPPQPEDSVGTRAARDTSSAPADTGAVPVPEPTQPLGDRPGARLAMPDSLTTQPVASSPTGTAPAAPPSGPAPSGATPVSPDSCWRVQITAKAERLLAERLMAAARSQLEVAWVIEREKGLYKVRTRDCLSAAAAESLRQRAIASGFAGAFKVRKKP